MAPPRQGRLHRALEPAHTVPGIAVQLGLVAELQEAAQTEVALALVVASAVVLPAPWPGMDRRRKAEAVRKHTGQHVVAVHRSTLAAGVHMAVPGEPCVHHTWHRLPCLRGKQPCGPSEARRASLVVAAFLQDSPHHTPAVKETPATRSALALQQADFCRLSCDDRAQHQTRRHFLLSALRHCVAQARRRDAERDLPQTCRSSRSPKHPGRSVSPLAVDDQSNHRAGARSLW
mmetsp:Transcript_70925/g.125357  ORF Transcript_70925/g.125357 Transcript_70925/m.125357 type:complete len:232 (+) Transcript_70925:507-1202(+)